MPFIRIQVLGGIDPLKGPFECNHDQIINTEFIAAVRPGTYDFPTLYRSKEHNTSETIITLLNGVQLHTTTNYWVLDHKLTQHKVDEKIELFTSETRLRFGGG